MEQFIILIQKQQPTNGFGQDLWQLLLEIIDFVSRIDKRYYIQIKRFLIKFEKFNKKRTAKKAVLLLFL